MPNEDEERHAGSSRTSARGQLDRTMVVAVALMMVMQVSFVDDVHVVAVRDGLVVVAVVIVGMVSFPVRVGMPAMMRVRACVLRRASIRILRSHAHPVLLDAIPLLMLEAALAEVVDVSLVSNARVPAARAMSMRLLVRVLRSIVHVRTSARDAKQEPCAPARAAAAPLVTFVRNAPLKPSTAARISSRGPRHASRSRSQHACLTSWGPSWSPLA
jgi:hypothetical protein